jgi:hypothetical protein
MSTRWIIVVTAQPAVCVEHEGDAYSAQKIAAATAQEHGCQCVLLGKNHDLWHLMGNYRPTGRAPQERANGEKHAN